jgi:hypothetical protein
MLTATGILMRIAVLLGEMLAAVDGGQNAVRRQAWCC